MLVQSLDSEDITGKKTQSSDVMEAPGVRYFTGKLRNQATALVLERNRVGLYA